MKVRFWGKEGRVLRIQKGRCNRPGAAAVAFFSGCSSSPQTQGAGQATVELKLAHFFPGSHPAEVETDPALG